MSDLVDSTDSLRRVLARPGTFSTLFPETTQDDLVGVLLDGLAEVQLDGMLTEFSFDDTGTVTPDLTAPQSALVILYAGVRLIRSELLNRAQHKRYVGAGGVTFEEDQATNVLRDIMKTLNDQKERIREIASRDYVGAFGMVDQYFVRANEGRLNYFSPVDYSAGIAFDPLGGL